jgi:hypothetical protein
MWCQAQIFVILLFAFTLQSAAAGGLEQLTDVVLSIVMIGMVSLLLLYFLLKFVATLRHQVRKTQRSARDLLELDDKYKDLDSPKGSTSDPSDSGPEKKQEGTVAQLPGTGKEGVQMTVVTSQAPIERNKQITEMVTNPRPPSESVIAPPGGSTNQTTIPA